VRHIDTQTETDRGVAGQEGGRETYNLSHERIRRGDSHTTRHDRHTGTTIEIGTGRDETRHDKEWRCMPMGGEGEE
jgi:hypothetical protein